MGQFASDAFGGSDGTVLTTYSASWTKVTSDSASKISSAGRVYGGAGGSRHEYNATPASADYSVNVDVYVMSTGDSGAAGPIGRAAVSGPTFYLARTAQGSGYQLYKCITGSYTQLGSTSAKTFSAGNTYNVKLDMAGTAIKLYAEGSGTASISQTDSAISAANKPGIYIYSGGTPSNTVGHHVDNFSADESGGTDHSLTASALDGASPTLQSGALMQEHALAASALAGAAPTLQSPALSQNHSLAASNLGGGAPTLGTPALTLAGTLVANDIAGSAPVLQTPALTQNHSLTATGLVGTAPVLQSPALTQEHTVTASNLTSAAPTLGTPALSASGDTYALAANAITGSAPALALAVLVQDHSLTATAILGSSPVLSSPGFGQQHLLTGSNIVAGAPALGTPDLTSGTSGGTGATVEEIVAALQAAVIPVDIAKINGTAVAGSGTDGDPWR